MRYYAAFDLAQLPAWQLQIDPAQGTAVTIQFNTLTGTDANSDATTKCFHYGLSSQFGWWGLNHQTWFNGSSVVGLTSVAPRRLEKFADRAFAHILQTAIRAAAAAVADWTADEDNFDVTFNNATSAYTLSYAENFTATFTSSRARLFLGFASLSNTGASSYTGTSTPTFCIAPSVDASHDPSVWMEPDGVASQALADDGKSYGIARSTAPLYQDWTQAFENKEKTLRHITAQAEIDSAGSATHPYTFQDLIFDCRTVEPFVVYDGFGEESGFAAVAYKFREDGAYLDWASARATPGNDNQFHIPFRCVVEGFAHTIIDVID